MVFLKRTLKCKFFVKKKYVDQKFSSFSLKKKLKPKCTKPLALPQSFDIKILLQDTSASIFNTKVHSFLLYLCNNSIADKYDNPSISLLEISLLLNTGISNSSEK